MAGSIPPVQELNLLLLGKTGAGISSTGNSILREDSFETSDCGHSCTKQIELSFSKRFNYSLKVVDTPGLFDVSISDNLRRSATTEVDTLSQCFSHCPEGFHALVLVFKYPLKTTQEESKSIARLREIFGHNFVREHSVIVVTNGEDFDLSAEENPQTFTSWCRKQTGTFGYLYIECKERAVLFYNLSKEDKKDRAVKEFIATASRIDTRYTTEMFEEQRNYQQKLIVGIDQPQITEKLKPKLDDVKKTLKKLENSRSFHGMVIRQARKLEAEAEYLKNEIENEDCGSDVFKFLKDEVDIYLRSIKNLIVKHEEQRKHETFFSRLFT